MQLTFKEFRHLAQSTQSILTSVALVAALALAWQALKTYRETKQLPVEIESED